MGMACPPPAPWSSYPDDPFITREIDMQDGMSASGLPGQLCPEVVTTIYGLLTEISFRGDQPLLLHRSLGGETCMVYSL